MSHAIVSILYLDRGEALLRGGAEGELHQGVEARDATEQLSRRRRQPLVRVGVRVGVRVRVGVGVRVRVRVRDRVSDDASRCGTETRGKVRTGTVRSGEVR